MIYYELFNLSTDEEETTNLAANGSTLYDSFIQKLLQGIEVWQRSVKESAKKYCFNN